MIVSSLAETCILRWNGYILQGGDYRKYAQGKPCYGLIAKKERKAINS